MSDLVVLVGCGKMGGALLAGWRDRSMDASAIVVVESHPETASTVRQRHGVSVVADSRSLTADVRPHAVVFAVKPQIMDSVVPAYATLVESDPDAAPVFLSVAAGRTIASIARSLGSGAAIVRAMPNTPAAIRRGITVACGNELVDESRRAACTELLEAVGTVAWIEDESLMDAVTAVSGSGPAYVFLLAECLIAAGIDAGLPAELAHQLALETVAGAGELLYRSAETPDILRQHVTSPGGTTAAALDVLMGSNGLEKLVTSAVRAATKRSRELAG
jgi:pyrroline-5-carboxylate reductase